MRECFECGIMMRGFGMAWCGLAWQQLAFFFAISSVFLRHFVCLLFRHNRHLIAFINWYEVLNHRHDSSLLRFECIIIACGWMDWLHCILFFYYGDDVDDDEPHFEFGIMAKLENNQTKFIHSFMQTTTIFEAKWCFLSFFEFKEMVELAFRWQKRKCIVEHFRCEWKSHRYLSLYCLHFRPGLASWRFSRDQMWSKLLIRFICVICISKAHSKKDMGHLTDTARQCKKYDKFVISDVNSIWNWVVCACAVRAIGFESDCFASSISLCRWHSFDCYCLRRLLAVVISFSLFDAFYYKPRIN